MLECTERDAELDQAINHSAHYQSSISIVPFLKLTSPKGRIIMLINPNINNTCVFRKDVEHISGLTCSDCEGDCRHLYLKVGD